MCLRSLFGGYRIIFVFKEWRDLDFLLFFFYLSAFSYVLLFSLFRYSSESSGEKSFSLGWVCKVGSVFIL